MSFVAQRKKVRGNELRMNLVETLSSESHSRGIEQRFEHDEENE